MDNKAKTFIDVLLRGSDVSGWALSAFAIGLIAVGIVSNGVYDFLIEPSLIIQHSGIISIAIIILIAAAYGLFYWGIRQRNQIHVDIDESQLAPAKDGIIWLFSPSIDPLMFALQYHQDREAGNYCWLVMQRDSKNLENAYTKLLAEKNEKQWSNLTIYPFYISETTAAAAHEAVSTIITREAPEAGLQVSQLTCDITGGLKPLTAGMMLAAIANDCMVEYVKSDRNEQGRPIPNTQRVVSVDTKFSLVRNNS